MRGRSTSRVLLFVVVVLLGMPVAVPPAPAIASAAGAEVPAGVDPGSVLIPCSQADVRTTLTADAHLDPTCEYHAGFDITASNVVLDCQGALIKGPVTGGNLPRGIEVVTPADVDMSGVTVRNCRVEGFINSLRATRTGFRQLPEGHEFDNHLSNIVIEDSEFSDSRGVGVFVDGYVSGVTIQRSTITGAGSTGIYLEAGSKDNTVVDNEILDSGYRENGPEGSTRELFGFVFRYWGTGREGLAIDGSFENHVAGNRFSGNSNGGIFLYTNCGEYWQSNPGRWYERRTGANDNLIEHNRFEGGRHGIWVGSRMGENTLPMECSDEPYLNENGLWVTLDEAHDNTIRENEFVDVHYGVRVEDDRTVVEGNEFTSTDPDHHAVVVGTHHRTTELGRPVTGTELIGNSADIPGNANPYRWIWGHESTRVSGNTALGAPVGVCEGEPLPHTIFVMVLAFVFENPGDPPAPNPGVEYPLLGAIDPCEEPSLLPPDPPTAVEVTAGPGQASVRWQPGFNDGGVPITGYDVLDGGDEVVVSTAPGVLEVDVIGLEPGSSQTFRIVARNDIGASAPSAPAGPATIGSPQQVFADVPPGHAFGSEIDWAVASGLTSGYADGTFRPVAPVTRGELAAFLHRMAGRPEVQLPSTPTFPDVGAGHPFAAEVEWLSTSGLVQGFSDGTFRPGSPMARQALAAVLHRAAASPVAAVPPAPTFTDVEADHAFAAEIEWAAASDLVEGFRDGTFRPTDAVARQALAAVLYRSSTRFDWPG